MKTRVIFYAVFCDGKVIERLPHDTDIFKVIEDAKILREEGHRVFIRKYEAIINI